MTHIHGKELIMVTMTLKRMLAGSLFDKPAGLHPVEDVFCFVFDTP